MRRYSKIRKIFYFCHLISIPMKKLAVVALGGNALLRGDQKGTIDEQEANARSCLLAWIFQIRRQC